MKLPKSVTSATERGDARRAAATRVPASDAVRRDAEVVDYAVRIGPATDRRFCERK